MDDFLYFIGTVLTICYLLASVFAFAKLGLSIDESDIKKGHPIVLDHKVYRCGVEGEK